MAKKRNRITAEMSKTIAESSPLIKKTTVTNLEEKENTNNITEIKLDNLQKNPFQPRIDINVQSLNELISSIEQNGLLQPIIVTEKDNSGLHTIVAGHRRYEAFKIIGKKTIQAIVMEDLKDKDLAILSLTENLMRENLHPIENAIAIKNILDNNIVESQNKLAEYVGLSKGYVSKLMNILKLPTEVLKIIKEENYKDINILILLNKLSSTEKMLETYHSVKELSRADAEKYIKDILMSSKEKSINKLFTVKVSKSKINVNLNIKDLSSEQIEVLNQKITNFNDEITKLASEWKQ